MSGKVVVLTGGVGGAKLVHGLARILPPGQLTAIVNTGDDFTYLGLPICPDMDTLLYTLSGKANAAQGWGRADESWAFMAALRSLDGPDWFNLGDGDLALHVMRQALYAEGLTKTEVAARFASTWGVEARLLPASDNPVSTMLDTDAGRLDFQSYFVREQCQPIVNRIFFTGAEEACASLPVLAALEEADVILIAPSNPWLSVDPILAINGIGTALVSAKAPVVAISPLIGGKAVKGPTAKIMAELGLSADNVSIARHYAPLIDGLLIHDGDTPPAALPSCASDILMTSDADKERVAGTALDFATGIK